MPRITTGGIRPVVTLCMLMVLAVLSGVPSAAAERGATRAAPSRGATAL